MLEWIRVTWREVSAQRLKLIELALDAEDALQSAGYVRSANAIRTRLMTITQTSRPEQLIRERTEP